MNIYIGYKYRNNKNKEELKEMLTTISDSVSSLGHKTFVLDRDVYNWKYGRSSTSKSILSILKNMSKSDTLLAIVDCDSKSVGLVFESACAKCLGKKVILAVKEGINKKPFSNFSHNTIEFKDKDDLVNKLQSSLKSSMN